ncbi:MAG: hypothetical protein ACK41T_04630 [Pseudobdellovibrio sp.]
MKSTAKVMFTGVMVVLLQQNSFAVTCIATATTSKDVYSQFLAQTELNEDGAKILYRKDNLTLSVNKRAGKVEIASYNEAKKEVHAMASGLYSYTSLLDGHNKVMVVCYEEVK